MITKEQADEEARLLPWFRYARWWPDEQHAEMCWLLANAMLTIHSACLVGNPAPVVEEMWHRMSTPQIGDLVLETGTVWHKDWPERALGWLTRKERDPIGGYYWHVESLYLPPPSLTRWENCSFIALPCDLTQYLTPPGKVVFTRDSLVTHLSRRGMAVRDT